MSLEVLELMDSEFAKWDAFVMEAQDSTFFHRAGWKSVIESAFSHKAFFLYAMRDGKIEGILPLVHMKSLLFGNNLVSLPFCVYGGIVSSNEEAASALRSKACELAIELGVGSLELRNQNDSGAGWPIKTLYSTFRKEIQSDHEANMASIPRKRRAMIRKSLKAGVEGELDSGYKRFYKTYAESVRNLGTPVFSEKFFCALRETFQDDCRVLMITHQGQDVAGLMSFYFKDQVLPYYAGSLEAAKSVAAHDFMYWELIRLSCEEGIKWFDFGRSKEGTGPYLFKKGWGFEPEQLHYEYFLVKADTIPEVNPANPKYKLFIDLWKRLPVPVANKLGPFLSKDLG